jgi:hypothetical protein
MHNMCNFIKHEERLEFGCVFDTDHKVNRLYILKEDEHSIVHGNKIYKHNQYKNLCRIIISLINPIIKQTKASKVCSI